MPRIYEDLRDKFIAQGLAEDKAKTKAAKIYNSIRDKKPSLPKLSNKPEKK